MTRMAQNKSAPADIGYDPAPTGTYLVLQAAKSGRNLRGAECRTRRKPSLKSMVQYCCVIKYCETFL